MPEEKHVEKMSSLELDFSGAMEQADRDLVRTLGTQVTFWGFGCDREAIDAPCKIVLEMEKYVAANKLTLKDKLVSRFEPQGLTVVLVLEESHLLVNTWPEHGVIQVEIFSCREIETGGMLEIFERVFKSARTYMHELK